MKALEFNTKINKNTVIKGVVILLALFIGYNIYNFQANNIKTLQEKTESEMKKNAVIGDLSVTEKTFNSYKDFLNKKDVTSAINTIGNIAKESGLTISSIKPSGQEKYAFYFKYTFSISFDVNDYHSLAKFINNLERSHDLYFIDKLTVTSVIKPNVSEKVSGPENTLSVSLTLSTIIL